MPAAPMPVCCLGKKQLLTIHPVLSTNFRELPNNIFYQSCGAHPPSYSMGTEILSQGYSGRGSKFDHSPQSSSEVRHEQTVPLLTECQGGSFIFTYIFRQRIYQTCYLVLNESGKTKIKMKLMEPQGKMWLTMCREEL